jgi:ribulose-phosphate 3-epimerase
LVEIAPSILSADFSRLGEEVRTVRKGGAHLIHVDVMDGHFVPNITIGPVVVSYVSKAVDLPLDVHLMIAEPDRYIKDFVKSGARMVSVHYEAAVHLHRTVSLIREEGASPGVVLNPATPVAVLDDILEEVDFVLLMSVNPGFGGQKFIPAVLKKVRALKETIRARGLKVRIELDGGVCLDNLREVVESGVDIVVAGSAIYNKEYPAETVRKFIKVCKETGSGE